MPWPAYPDPGYLIAPKGPSSNGNVNAVHATVKFNGHDSLLVEVFDHATGTWVEIASKNVEGQHLGSADVATVHSDGSAGWNAGSLRIRVTDRTTGQVIEQGSGQFQTVVNADGSVTIRIEDRIGGDNDFNDVVMTLENDTGGVTRRSLGAVQPLPALPFTDEQLNQIQKDGSTLFFDKLAQAPDGSPAKILYNLFRARSLDQLPEFKGKVDLNAVNADIQTYMQDPAVQQLLAAAQGEAAFALTGIDSATAAKSIHDSLLSDETISHLRQLTPEARQQYVNSALTQLAFFDPGLAKAAMQELMKALLTQGTPQEMLANASPEATELAVQAVFQISITQSRFGVGALANAGTSLNKLTEKQLGDAGKAFAEWMRTGKGDLAELQYRMSEVNLDAETTFALYNFGKNLADTGALGAIGGVLAGIAVAQDFMGTGTMTTHTPWGIVNTTADVMSLVGASENFYKAGVTALGIGRAGFEKLANFAAALSAANVAAPRAVAEATEGIQLTGITEVDAQIIGDALSSNASIVSAVGPDGVEALAAGLAESGSAGSSVSIAAALPAGVTEAQIAGITEMMANLSLSETPAANAAIIQAGIEANPALAASLGPEGVASVSGSLAGSVNSGPLNLEQDLSGFTIGEITAAPATDAAVATLIAPETAAEVSSAGLTAAEIAAATEAGGLATGVAGESAAGAGAIAGTVAEVDAAAASAASVSVFARVLSGLGVLGAAANFLYGAKSADAAHKSFADGDVTGGVLSTGAATGFFAGGAAGLAAFIGTTFEVAAVSGPLAPLVALGATLTGFAFALGNYFHQKHRHQEQIDDARNFLASGVGTNRSYLLP
jgi:hypothetical protein